MYRPYFGVARHVMGMNSSDAESLIDEQAEPFTAIFATMTAKQHQVFALVAENRSSKEIAAMLGVSESAINQRIEVVRGRAGSPPRAHLARAYREFITHHAMPAHLEHPVAQLAALDDRPPAPTQQPSDWIVPPALSGRDAGLNRVAAMVVIAAGLLMVAMMGLGVAQALAAAL
jgi:DNA-binding CsgD family transcriptional regulator